jgi:hypothetical protein
MSADGPVNVNAQFAFYLSFVVAAVGIIVATRGHLSYERYQRETSVPTDLATSSL